MLKQWYQRRVRGFKQRYNLKHNIAIQYIQANKLISTYLLTKPNQTNTHNSAFNSKKMNTQQPIQEQYITTTTTNTNVIPPAGSTTLGNNNLGSNRTAGKQKRGLFGRRKAKSANYGNGSGLNNSLNSTYGTGLNNGYGNTTGLNDGYGFGVGDVTHHSYRWAHRDKNLAISDNYGGAPPRGIKASRRSNRRSTGSLGNRQQLQQGQPIVQQTQSTTTTQGLQGYPQQSFQTTIVEEVPVGGMNNGMGGLNNGIAGNNGLPANNIPAATTKKRHPFQTFFGRKHHDSGAHTGMLGSGPTGGLGFPSRTNVVA
eukprot:TRINITY_DN1179_c0_g1_i4.p1 TRINITY_DN1179_c0_g1~~TRINITY_DN1179_c0_g1_i4.p1  ORF type:complete len:312 (-),score=72.95 TRINITY_DN1179_c0_g1_i4:48-983(-)